MIGPGGTMSTQEVEASWQVLRQIVREWAGDSAELAEVTPLVGGCVNTTLCLTTAAGDKAVLKITSFRVDRSYADEELQLAMLRDAGIPAPRVYRCKTGTLEEPFSYILMEFMPGVDLAEAKNRCQATEFATLQEELASLILKLHERTGERYCRLLNRETPAFDSWPALYRDIYGQICQEVFKSGQLPGKTRKIIQRVHDRLDRLIAHDDRPRLLHWDLWSTNILAGPDSSGNWHITALLDPHCKFGHAEAELAYLQLFNTATPEFMKAYQQERKLPPEYHRVRKPIYQLYDLLNHVCLFGHEYVKRTVEAAEKVAAVV
jgi:fructosamine-3-kinase